VFFKLHSAEVFYTYTQPSNFRTAEESLNNFGKEALSTHQLKPIPPHIQNLDGGIFLEFFAELGDKNIHASGVKKVV
jgi:hypothetical protein